MISLIDKVDQRRGGRAAGYSLTYVLVASALAQSNNVKRFDRQTVGSHARPAPTCKHATACPPPGQILRFFAKENNFFV